MKGRGKREISEKTFRPTASSGTIPTCESLVTRPGIEPGSPWWEASVPTAQPPWPLIEFEAVCSSAEFECPNSQSHLTDTSDGHGTEYYSIQTCKKVHATKLQPDTPEKWRHSTVETCNIRVIFWYQTGRHSTVTYMPELASFLHWLLHRYEAAPILTEMHVIGAHNCEVFIYWCRITQGVSYRVKFNDKLIANALLLTGYLHQNLAVVPRGTRVSEIKACLKRFLHYSDLSSGAEAKMYPGIAQIQDKPMEWLCEIAILTPKNNQTAVINDILLKSFEGEELVYNSIHTVVNIDEAVDYPMEFLNTPNPLDLPY
ncbi:hypothetical protein PR048_009681 [Dryococelus australis]|uniref:ATP-dependent DNA helicase n=1 Tax=Dryococelus australis TaxID=614101 RepID=A0ABQ9I0M5_9NEOP|nr:hypothetical protein PR048_009681 [Dryococelus australis]